jgi:hypothetical protein
MKPNTLPPLLPDASNTGANKDLLWMALHKREIHETVTVFVLKESIV